ncbi:MAG: hypothetical protein HYT70_03170 [Candidatus Aenigmarchaeota archaeon]|nr:hypothetical protein [Candidatus Aenigmarchaeota archaeon]
MGVKLFSFIAVLVALVPVVDADATGTNFAVVAPQTITTTVGELTEARISIYNKGSVEEAYTISYAASSPNFIDITKSAIVTQAVGPKQTIQVSTTIRTLTDDNNVLAITVRSSATAETLNANIPVRSGKYSLPEFGFPGFVQIVFIASILYFLHSRRIF